MGSKKYLAINAIFSFLLAVSCIAIVFGVISGKLQMASFVALVGLAHGLLALPIFIYLNNSCKVSLFNCMLSGYVVGSLPYAVMSFPVSGEGSSASVNGVATVISGVPTFDGWWQYFLGFSFFGAIGALIGLMFWFVLRYFVKRNSTKFSSMLRLPLTWFTAGVVVFVLLMPSITKDRSCHNPLRDGGSSIAPVASITLNVPMTDWDEVKSIFSSFAKEHN